MNAKPARAKTMQLLPMGSKTEKAWRITNDAAPDKADALAVSALRYALTGENADGPGVPPNAWAEAKAEIDLLLTRRAANPWGCKGKPGEPNSEPNGEPNPKPTGQPPLFPLPSSEEKKTEGMKTEDSSLFGIRPPSSSSDFGTWARLQEDPVTVALAAAGEGREKAGVYGAQLKALKDCKGAEEGARLFVEECVSFVAEIEAGEEVRNRGKALVARLKGLANAPTATRPADAPRPVSAMMDWDAQPPPVAPSTVRDEAEEMRRRAEERARRDTVTVNLDELPAPDAPAAPVEPAQVLAATVAAVADPFKREPLRPMTPEEEEANRREKAAKWEEYKKRKAAAGAGEVA